MPALRKLHLDLTGLDISQKYQFRSLLRDFGSGTTWRQLQHLRLSGDDLFSDELMEKAKSINSLELEVTVKTGWIQVLWPLAELPNLRKLCVDLNAQLEPGDLAVFLQGIPWIVQRAARGVESLAIMEGTSSQVQAPQDLQAACNVSLP